MSQQKFKSISGVFIRLTSERISHILKNHPEMISHIFELKESISKPQFIIQGKNDELIALKDYKKIFSCGNI